MFKINKKELRQNIEQGYVSERKHPQAPYYIYNYTPSAQFDQVWNEITLNCRGLILDEAGNIIARPFKKFFNIGEYNQHNFLGKIPNYTWFDIFDKLDGSLGILYKTPDGKFQIATRGSFESEQAIKGTEIFHRMFKNPSEIFLDDYTYLFEIIYPENRIVVNYGNKEELILLAVKNKQTGDEYGYEQLLEFANRFEIPVTQYYGRVAYNRHAFLKLGQDIPKGAEGFVLKFDNGLRVKIKSEEYTRLHRLITGVSNKSIWDLLRTGQDIDELLYQVPDEFYDWVLETKNDLEVAFEAKRKSASTILQLNADRIKDWSRKEVAEFFSQYPKETRSILFAMVDNKPYEHIIWKQLKPAFSRPFKEET